MWSGIFQYPAISRVRVARLYTVNAPNWGLYRAGLLSHAYFLRGWIRSLARLLKNWPQQEVDGLFDWLANEQLVTVYQEEMLRSIENHRAEGTAIVLASSYFQQAVEKVAVRVGADAALGTPLEFKNGIVTGKITQRVCVGPRRLDFIREYLKSNQLPITLKDCIAYGHSYLDAPMLAAAGQAVAVYPDKDLRDAALEQGWDILE